MKQFDSTYVERLKLLRIQYGMGMNLALPNSEEFAILFKELAAIEAELEAVDPNYPKDQIH